MKFTLNIVLFAGCLVAGAEDLAWHDARTLPLEGRVFADAPAFGRLPLRHFGEFAASDYARGIALNSAGLCLRFTTTANALTVRWSVCEPDLAWCDMTGAVKSGFDVYGFVNGAWRHEASLLPWAGLGVVTTNFTKTIGVTPNRPYQIHFPTYNTVGALEIGVPAGTTFSPLPPRTSGIDRPVVFYGTSITQGCSASRPGLAYTARVGRMLDVPVVNLGFSGNGRLADHILDALGEIDASCYVLDCLWNMSLQEVKDRTESFVRRLDERRPAVPIVLMEKVGGEGQGADDAHLRSVVAKLKAENPAKWAKLHLVSGRGMLPPDGEGTVDRTHPNDLGMQTLAASCAAVLRQALFRTRHQP